MSAPIREIETRGLDPHLPENMVLKNSKAFSDRSAKQCHVPCSTMRP